MRSDVEHFRLYVAGQSANSNLALVNLRALCERHLAGRHEIEVIDVFTEPERALADGVMMTPTLVLTAFTPPRVIVGNLSRADVVLRALNETPQE